MTNVIKWVTLTEFARRAGMSLNTFKKNYLWQLPEPQMVNDTRKSWSEKIVNGCLEKIQSGEIVGMAQEDNA